MIFKILYCKHISKLNIRIFPCSYISINISVSISLAVLRVLRSIQYDDYREKSCFFPKLTSYAILFNIFLLAPSMAQIMAIIVAFCPKQ